MKTTVFFRMIVLVVMTITGVINAELKAQDTNFVTNEVKEGDLVTSKVIYRMDGSLYRHMKYDFSGVSYHDWLDYFNFNRNESRENALIDRLGINMSERYNFINCNFGTYPVTKRREDMNPTNPFRNIEMTFIEGTHIFDWIKILLGAQEIHTVETSLYYILAKLGLRNNVYIYSKFPGMNDDFSYMRDNSPREWNYIK